MDLPLIHLLILVRIQLYHVKVGWIHNENSGFSLFTEVLKLADPTHRIVRRNVQQMKKAKKL
jgi:hypothetical protein